MSDAENAQVPEKPRRLGWIIAVASVAFAAFAGSALTTWLFRSMQAVVPKVSSTTTVVHDSPSVIVAIRELARLETTSFHIERVIDLRDRQTHAFGLIQGDDAILLIAAGDVVAGIDLSQLAETDVRYGADGKTARLVLPEPIIFSTRLDNGRTYVHSRKTDTFAVRAETLETRARQLAEQSLKDAALEAGILAQARTGAIRTVTTLVRSLGFQQVEVVFAKE
jgi:hypothetical protein